MKKTYIRPDFKYSKNGCLENVFADSSKGDSLFGSGKLVTSSCKNVYYSWNLSLEMRPDRYGIVGEDEEYEDEIE